MNITLQKSKIAKQASIQITGSKSESNRLLLLKAVYPELELENVSNSDDSVLMTKALESTESVIDIHHAGTAMRFLTAYFAIQEDHDITLTGSSRMKERPIKILVEALKELGADISYLENEGCPPLKIKGRKLTKNKVCLKANVSSQYISALLLIASKLENGLELTLEGEMTSVPYIKMTLSLLDDIGVETSFVNNIITVKPFIQHPVPNTQSRWLSGSAPKTQNPRPNTLVVESDWSSASYYFSLIALSEIGTEITLSSYKENSLQGDSDLVNIYKSFGVTTQFNDNTITIKKESAHSKHFEYDLVNAPDIAQTIAVSCFALGMSCHLIGLHTLKIKETDRLVALKNEIEKLGGKVQITDYSLNLEASNTIKEYVPIATYHDHRMAMAFAPLALRVPIIIEEADVVSKSYPTFWKDLKTIGIKIAE